MNKTGTILSLIAAVLLFVATTRMPYGYYTFMRIAVTGIAGYLIYTKSQKQQRLWLIFYIASAIIFNPLIPVYLRHRHNWMPIDLVFAIAFIVSAFENQNQ